MLKVTTGFILEVPYKGMSCNGAVSFWHRRSGLGTDGSSQGVDNSSENDGLERKQL